MIRKNLRYQLLEAFFIGAFFGSNHLYSADSSNTSNSQDFIESSATQMVITRDQFNLAATELGVESADERDVLFLKCHPFLLICDDERERLLQEHQNFYFVIILFLLLMLVVGVAIKNILMEFMIHIIK